MNSKAKLRQHFRQFRQQLTPKQQSKAAQDFLKQIDCLGLFAKQNFACYLAQDGELSLTPLIEKLWQLNKTVTLPVIQHKYENNLLAFKLYTPAANLVPNQYHIFEPDDANTVPPEKLDVIFVPLVAFDQDGMRLGMGGGFYDSTLAELKIRSNNMKIPRPLFVGVGHACQQAERLISDYWDVRMDAIVTDCGMVEKYELFSV